MVKSRVVQTVVVIVVSGNSGVLLGIVVVDDLVFRGDLLGLVSVETFCLVLKRLGLGASY